MLEPVFTALMVCLAFRLQSRHIKPGLVARVLLSLAFIHLLRTATTKKALLVSEEELQLRLVQ